jgi:1-acyl-sn-glycerol-3-phosphate acyltransferase
MNKFLRYFWFLLIIKPIVLVIIGLGVRNRKELFAARPAIIAANHNSHLDTMVLTTLFPPGWQKYVRPVAAADYFLKNRLLAWFALKIIGIIPIERKPGASRDVLLSGCYEALNRGEILILFPEGTRGEPEELAAFKSGVAHLAEQFPQVPVIPVFMHGLGKTLPRGECLPVPFFCDVVIGSPLYWEGSKDGLMNSLVTSINSLSEQVNIPSWD